MSHIALKLVSYSRVTMLQYTAIAQRRIWTVKNQCIGYIRIKLAYLPPMPNSQQCIPEPLTDSLKHVTQMLYVYDRDRPERKGFAMY